MSKPTPSPSPSSFTPPTPADFGGPPFVWHGRTGALPLWSCECCGQPFPSGDGQLGDICTRCGYEAGPDDGMNANGCSLRDYRADWRAGERALDGATRLENRRLRAERAGKRRVTPEPILLDLLSLERAPRDPKIRADVVRLALSSFAATRRYDRLACVLLSVDEADLGSLLLTLEGAWESWDLDGADRDRRRWVKLAMSEGALRDETFVRLADVAADVYSWEGEANVTLFESEFDQYVRPAWLVLADEVEFEREARDAAHDDFGGPIDRPEPLDRDSVRRLAETDRRAETRL